MECLSRRRAAGLCFLVSRNASGARESERAPLRVAANRYRAAFMAKQTPTAVEENYTVLARRYRPQTFADLIGQEPTARALINALKGNRVAHAYLFTGARGVGKTSTARILAKAAQLRKRADAHALRRLLQLRQHRQRRRHRRDRDRRGQQYRRR